MNQMNEPDCQLACQLIETGKRKIKDKNKKIKKISDAFKCTKEI